MRIDELKIDDLLVNACKENGIVEATKIQEQVIPVAMGGRDVVAISQTGSGKTLAFILPIVSCLLSRDRSFYCLIIAPTRELSSQIVECLGMFKSTGLRTCLLVGGVSFGVQTSMLAKHPHIVVGTPGRIAEHILKTKSFKIDRVRKVVLDEADRFFEQDFGSDLDTIFGSLRSKRQTLLFTATMPDKVCELSKSILVNPKTIKVVEGYETVETLKEYYVFVPMNWKNSSLVEMLGMHPGEAAIVFVSMCVSAQIVCLALNRLGIHSEALHGGLEQEKRDMVVNKFKRNEFDVLVCTDVGSRGLDICHVGLVINFDVPKNGKDYIHRVGRTARAGKCGTAVTFVTQYDVEQIQRIEFALGKKLEGLEVSRCSDSDNRMVEEAVEAAKDDLKQITKSKNRYRKKA
ncbi:ATP-dependent rRNA helicase [Ordospora colligata]|uniref:ATP-dependent rRNA helicase n=1 Tax=Ordospora colligata OC4 TaxID=1354746 RepID=A0A0B2UKS4_9MICR|nr:ATP-dependent rRNA helicase [Ordospora colligata OC4]KHN69632.1 ATP-dependent rRNA helicase [Ordospora colligata OC4]TBU15751.1 ATP-dependent rRNA helicase [Ordospora colligata]TBU15879.1 ATP-dependent rRNA helicase [Ordospora colligata]TBU18773.1 ATP-dependent rRNA helicase [Ordospora colligata]